MSVASPGAWLVSLVSVPLLRPVFELVQRALRRGFSRPEFEGRAVTWKLRERADRRTIKSLMMKVWGGS